MVNKHDILNYLWWCQAIGSKSRSLNTIICSKSCLRPRRYGNWNCTTLVRTWRCMWYRRESMRCLASVHQMSRMFRCLLDFERICLTTESVNRCQPTRSALLALGFSRWAITHHALSYYASHLTPALLVFVLQSIHCWWAIPHHASHLRWGVCGYRKSNVGGGGKDSVKITG